MLSKLFVRKLKLLRATTVSSGEFNKSVYKTKYTLFSVFMNVLSLIKTTHLHSNSCLMAQLVIE